MINSEAPKYPGLKVKAWAVFSGTTGVIVKGSGISSIVRNSVGKYTVTFSSAGISENVFAEGFANAGAPATPSALLFYGLSTTTASILVYISGALTDTTQVYVAFYE